MSQTPETLHEPAPDTLPARSHATSPARTARRARSKWTRKNPYPATIVSNVVLSGPASDKEVRHLVVSLGDSGIEYQPGDGIAIAPVNDADLVDRIIARLGVDPETQITDRRSERTLREALTRQYEISTASRYLVEYIAARTGDPDLSRLVADGDREAIESWLRGRDVLDLLDIDPSLAITPEELLGELNPLQHREYSISSSPLAHPGTAHITMATVRYRSGDRDRGGVCSTYLADRCPEGSRVDVFVTPKSSFRLPADDTNVVMIGPGTGVAPFRAFLHERAATNADGENWLFFGDRHSDRDFLYADEIERFGIEGILHRVDLAFSRDQDHKVYVQDRMRERGADLFAWLRDGAHVYVCGDANRMAPDVDAALVEIIAEHGAMTVDTARDYLDGLKRDKRYVRDVY